MNARDRVPLTLIVVLLLLAALVALLAPFVLAAPGPAEPVPDTADAPARPPVENGPAGPAATSTRTRMASHVPAVVRGPRIESLAGDRASGRGVLSGLVER